MPDHSADVTNPAIICLSADHGDVLRSQFARYEREYDLHVEPTAADAATCTQSILDQGGTVALFVLDTGLPDVDWRKAIGAMRALVPTARRVIVSPWGRFLEESQQLRGAQAAGKFDAMLLLPRGVRDEEFHGAIGELLNDWGATAAPQVESLHVITPRRDALTRQIGEFLLRAGMPHGVHDPDSEIGRAALARYSGAPDSWPLVAIPGR